MKLWLTVSEIARILNIQPVSVRRKAAREGWERRVFDGRGGKEYRYRLDGLPEDVQAAYAASLNTTIEALQGELKPPSKAPVKVNIGCYNCRSKEDKPIKNFDDCSEVERGIAFNRQKIIDAYGTADISVKQFVVFYNDGLVLPEIKQRLGRWGRIGTTAIFYQNWLRRY
jgi:hypothetical protein